MKQRTLGMVVALAIVAVLSLGSAGSALADPDFSGVTPSTASDGPGAPFQLTITGSNFSEIESVDAVRLQMAGPPFDTINAGNAQLNLLLPPSIACDVSTWAATPGTYDVEIDWWSSTLSGQIYPITSTMYGAFTVTAVTPPDPDPYITSVDPTQKTAGDPAFTLTVNGGAFATGALPAVVKWNGQALVTTASVVNPTAVLTAVVPADLIATPGTALITVGNPLIGGAGTTSSAMNFTISKAPPVLTGLAPATTWAKLVTPPAVVLGGSGFVSGATAVVGGAARAATFVSTTQLSVQLTAADIATAGGFTIAARNPQPGGGTSTALPFTVVSDTAAPVTTISGADANWHATPVTLTVTATDAQSGVQLTQWGIGIVPPWATLAGSTITVPAAAGGSADGVKVVSAFSTDNAGVAEAPPVTATVNICTVGPTTEASAPASVKKGVALKLGYVAESITPTCTVTIKILKSSGSVARIIRLGKKTSGTPGSYTFTCNLAKGKYEVMVNATDAAGNPQSSMNGDSFHVK